MKKTNILIAVLAVTVAAVSTAKAEGFSVDFDRGSLRAADLTEAVKMRSEDMDPIMHPKPVSTGFPAVFRQEGHQKAHKSVLAVTIKDILLECSDSGTPSDIYVSLNSSGSITVKRDGAVLRVLHDPAAVAELSAILSNRKDTVVEAWEEEAVSVSADGLHKKICRFFFEKICRWISCPAGQSVEDYNNCVQECIIRITPLGCQVTN